MSDSLTPRAPDRFWRPETGSWVPLRECALGRECNCLSLAQNMLGYMGIPSFIYEEPMISTVIGTGRPGQVLYVRTCDSATAYEVLARTQIVEPNIQGDGKEGRK